MNPYRWCELLHEAVHVPLTTDPLGVVVEKLLVTPIIVATHVGHPGLLAQDSHRFVRTVCTSDGEDPLDFLSPLTAPEPEVDRFAAAINDHGKRQVFGEFHAECDEPFPDGEGFFFGVESFSPFSLATFLNITFKEHVATLSYVIVATLGQVALPFLCYSSFLQEG